jgi:hypothetical protein
LLASVCQGEMVATNVVVEQAVATKDLLIQYDLGGSASNQVWVRADLFSEGSNLNGRSFSGDMGLVTPGAGKQARWLAGDDWNEQFGVVDVQLLVNDGIAEAGEVLSFPCALPKSGATVKSYTGDDGDLQVGTAWPATRFTVHDSSDQGYFTDHLTGLMWQRYGGNVGAWTTAVSAVESLELGGYDDWRLPNLSELRSLLSYGIPTSTFPAYQVASRGSSYFSSSTPPSASDSAWCVNIFDGHVFAASKSNGRNYLAVRDSGSAGSVSLAATGQEGSSMAGDDGSYQAGIAWPSPRFVDNGDNTVTDLLYGLMWMKSAYGGTWSSAVAHGLNLSYAGYSDWRLPNVLEMTSLMDQGASNQISAEWPGTMSASSTWWTSTSNRSQTNMAWGVTFGSVNSAVMPYFKTQTKGYYPVRSIDPSEIPDPPAAIPYQKTGQVATYLAGDDGSMQKGAWQAFGASYSSSQHSVIDPVTFLMWPLSPLLFSGTWEDAVQYCNDLVLDGYSDWRIPNLHEMNSIIHFGRVNPAFHSSLIAFPNTFYWTGTTCAQDTNRVWMVQMGNGGNYAGSKGSTYPVFPVRNSSPRLPKTGQTVSYVYGDDGTYKIGASGAYAAADRFRDHGNGTITDRQTDLMWLQTAAPSAATNWAAAVLFCNEMNYGGYSDWRLPHVRELSSFFDYGEATSVVPTEFPLMNVQTNLGYWTSTTAAGNTNLAWVFLLQEGGSMMSPKDSLRYFLPVRDDVQP